MSESAVKIKIKGDTADFEQKINGLGNTANSALGKAGSVLKGMLGSQLITKGVSMLVSGVKSAITAGMEFEASMSQVAAISGATSAELERLTEAARHYGETTKFTASQAASALNYMALAGWTADQSLEALPGVLDLAAASGMDLAAASDAVTDYISAFGMEASQAGYMADLMAYAQANANTSASQLSQAYGNCASSMHSAGQDIETTTAMLMALSNQGIKGSEAGTQMSAVMRDLTQKMENGQIKIGKTAITVQDAAGNFRDLNDILADVEKATEGMGTAEKSAAIMDTFTARSVKAINTILNEGLDNVNSYEVALRGSAGTAAEQAEIMMDNLQGDVQKFQSALEGLQITASESFSGIARETVQTGTSIMEQLTSGAKAGGLSGLADAAIGMIPQLTDRLLQGLEGAVTGLMGKLPSLVKKLADQVPKLLKSALNLGSVLIDAVTGAAGSVVESLAANLPEYVATIFENLPNLLSSIFKGALNIVVKLMEGIDHAFGLVPPNLRDRVEEAFRNADTTGIKVDDIQIQDITVDGEIDVEAYKKKIADARAAIDTALADFQLTPDEQAALEIALLNGSGADALQIALQHLNIPATTADAIVNSITEFRTKMDTVFAEFKIDDPEGIIAQQILDYTKKGGSLSEALQTFAGLSADEANAAAAQLQPGLDLLTATLNALNLDGVDLSTLTTACTTDRDLIVAALTMLGADDATIQTALAAIDELSGSIVAKVNAAFEAMKTAFTNGDIADDVQAAEDATETLNEAAEEGHKNIDTWLETYTAQLAAMNLSAEEYKKAVEDAQTKAQQMHEDLDATIQAAKDWVSENAGAKTAEVQAHVDELDVILDDIAAIEARVEALNEQLAPREYGVRTAVEMGYLTNANAQATAIAVTASEYEKAVLEAATEYENAVRDASDRVVQAQADKAAGTIDETEFDRIVREATDQQTTALTTREDAVQAAADEYDEHMALIGQSMVAADANVAAALKDVQEKAQLQGIAETLLNGLISEDFRAKLPVDELGLPQFAVDDLLQYVGLDDSSLQTLADGVGMSLDGLLDLITTAGENPGQAGAIFWNEFLEDLAPDKFNVDEAAAAALEGVDLSGLAAVLQVAFENGLLEGDWSDPNNVLETILADYVNSLKPEVAVEPDVTLEPEQTRKDIEREFAHEDDYKEPIKVEAPVEVEPEVEVNPQAYKYSMEDAYQALSTVDRFTTDPKMLEVNVEFVKGKLNDDQLKSLMSDTFGENWFADFGFTTADAAQLDEACYAAMTALNERIAEGAQEAGAAAEGVAEAVTAPFAGTEAVMQDFGLGADDGLKNGINNGLLDVAGAARTTAEAIPDAASSALAINSPSRVMYDIGLGVDEGFANGITAGAGTVISAAQRIADLVRETIQSALQIHSPSKVMARLGEFTGEGFSLGLTESLDGAIRAAQSVVGAANLRPRVDFSGVSDSISGSVQAIADIESERPTYMYLNGKLVGQAMRRDHAAAENSYNRSFAVGVGKA